MVHVACALNESSSHMDTVIPLILIPFPLSRGKAICMFWLQASTVNECATVRLVGLVRVPLLEKDRLNIMIAFIVGASNPYALCLVNGWDSHPLPPV